MSSSAKNYFYLLCKRAFDLLLSLPALLFIVPVLACAWFGALFSRSRFKRVILLGAGRQPYHGFTSESDTVRHALRLWDVLCGRASIVGPRILPLGQLDSPAIQIRATVPPGLVCLHRLRWRSNVAFCPEIVSDQEYAASASFRTDVSILMRAILVSLYGTSVISSDRSIEVLGVHIDNFTMPETLHAIESALQENRSSVQIAFVNADCLNRAAKNSEYRHALEEASLVLADGIGIRIAGAMLSRPIRQNVNGTDLFPLLCERLNSKSLRLFLLGARKTVLQDLSNEIRVQYPQIVICGIQDGYFEDEAAVVQQIADAAPDVLLVAFGAPLQEMFIARNKRKLGAKVCIGVGGLFDFYSGHTPRAPQWLREAGLEWTYRLYQEPRRMWRRYLLGNAVFLARVIAERLGVSYGPATTEVLR